MYIFIMDVGRLMALSLTVMLLGTPACIAHKGLFVMTSGVKSHINFFGGVIEALTQNGHQITFISPLENKFESGSVRQLLIEDSRVKLLGNTFKLNIFKISYFMSKYIPEQCVKTLANPEVQKLMKEDYDYIILPFSCSDCFLGYVFEKKLPLIYISQNVITSPFSERIGAPEFASVTPNKMLTFTYPLSFWERVASSLASMVTFPLQSMADRSIEGMCREMKLWSPETPPIWELQRQGSLAIINSVRSLEVPVKSTPPTIIYAGGIHIKPTKPLPQDLEEWLSGSGEPGFILFSLGTVVTPAHVKQEHLQSILTVFRSLNQRIIWKWDAEDIEDLPPNVKLSLWLPQRDILAHPKARLFITHGGISGTQEATYFGVPMIGMPVFGDQTNNIAELVAGGCGRQITWKELTEEKFRNVVAEALTNNSLRQRVERRSELMKDWPRNPSEEVVYWVDYVIRHKGAKHLQSPLSHLTWHQIYNVDVWLFFTTVSTAIIIIVLLLIKSCYKLCRRTCFKRKTE